MTPTHVSTSPTSTTPAGFNAAVIDEFRANQGRVRGTFEGTPLLLLHHTGAKSGVSRVNPVGYLRDDERYVVFASNGGAPSHPDWYRNLKAHPNTKIEVGSETIDVVAEEATNEERARIFAIGAERFPQLAEFARQTERVIPVMVLAPRGSRDLADMTTIVVGASRGLGRGIATVLAQAGAPVIAVARTAAAPVEPASGAGSIRPHVADGGDPTVPGSLLERYDPGAIVLVAGATPRMRPLQHHTWESFSVNWQTDVRIAFHWLREALLKPLRPGSRVIVISSGAALAGSPLSGGYAGAKATQRFITAYARDEAERAGLGITFTAVLPRLTPLTALGRPAVQAYAARSGRSEAEYLEQLGEPLTPEIAGAAVVELLRADAAAVAPAYTLTGAGLQTLS